GDELLDEPLESAACDWRGPPDHELAEPRLDVGLDPATRLRPRGRQQRGRIDARPPPLDRARELRRQLPHREADAVMVVLDLSAGVRRGRLDLLPGVRRLRRGQEAAQPAVTEPADASQALWRTAAEPDVERLQRQRPHARIRHREELAREGDAVL